MLDELNNYISMETIGPQELLLRLFLSLLFGFLIGLDRDVKNKPIDFRAYMIVIMSTCLIAIVAQELYVDYHDANGTLRIDLTRVIAGALTGIGFLGAGAIIKRDDAHVVGTATGASIWACGGIGLALGFGYYGIAVAGFICMLIILVFFGFLMSIFLSEKDREEKELS